MKISEQGIPANSTVESYLDNSDYCDSYGVCLTHPELDMYELYFAIFSFSPRWIKLLFHIRNKIVALFGLRGPSYKNLHNIKRKSEYRIGEMVGVFKLYSLEQNEIIVGGDDKHLNFRVSVQKIVHDEPNTVAVTTIVKFNNIFGRIYLFFIKPFHKIIIKRLIMNAIDSKRI